VVPGHRHRFSQDCIDQLIEAADPVSRPIVSALYYTIMDGHRVATIYQDNLADEGTFNTRGTSRTTS